jgi:O-antigen/teichoic acid export membrane protein
MSSPLIRNALANVLQALVGAGLLFALYRYINATLGVDQLGVWSVVLATASASRLADMGLSAGVIRFVARDRARGESVRAAHVVDTVSLTLMALVGVVLPLLYPLLAKLLPHLLHGSHLLQAQAILPYALVSLWLNIVAAAFQGGLDGCQRMDLRAGLILGGQAIMLLSAFWLVPAHGLVGLAWAQIGQGLFTMVAGRALLKRVLPGLPWLPMRWRKPVLREMLGYGANLQATNLFILLFDPVAKALMARFGGPAAAGYFTMANQVVIKGRNVIVAANQAIVPRVASLAEAEPGGLAHLYRENMSALIYVSLPAFTLLFAWAGGFSWLLTGAYHGEFVFLIGMLSVAWVVNIFCGPAYFSNMGSGQVGWNTLAHLIMGVLNAGLGWVLGSIYGAQGVAMAYAIALIAGSVILIGVYQHRNGVDWRSLFGREQLGLFAACAIAIVLGVVAPLRLPLVSSAAVAVGMLFPLVLLGSAAWFHPMRHRLLGQLRSGLSRT